MAIVLKMAFVIFLQVYWYKLRKKPESDWELLWIKIGKRFRNTLFELEGLLIKIGQLLSIRADLLPHGFINQIQDLTDHVPPSEWGEIKEILEREWGTSIEEHFLSIEEKAVASASIGEVYKAVLKSGEEVAIKVQRPDIQSIIKTDFRTLRVIIWFADHLVPLPKGFINFKVLFKELKEVIERELDFSQEKNVLLSFKERFKENESVIIPGVYDELSTSSVLVMDWLDGIKVTDKVRLNELGINRGDLVEGIMKVFLPQWLEPGVFHADPHSGNMLVSREGKIILLDFGMVGEISNSDAIYFQKLIEGLLSKNYVKAVDSLVHLGFLLPEADPRIMEKLLAEMMTIQPNQLKNMDLVAMKLEMNDMIQALPIQVPTRFVFLGRSFVTIEGVLRGLATDEELMALFKPIFMNWLKQKGNNKWSFISYWLQSQPVFKFFYSIAEFLKLPKTLEELKETEQRREFQFTLYENSKQRLFYLSASSAIGILVGIYTEHDFIMQLCIGVTALSSFGYLVFSYKLRKWMKFMHEKRR
ncbi:ABC1 kinase family protein [Evansella cellulosilytica]|nr:AarF/UbiB family protein [Evansella cellulosilytica]